MKIKIGFSLLFLLFFFSFSAEAQVRLSVTKKAAVKIGIAIPPFQMGSNLATSDEKKWAKKVRTVLAHDLEFAGSFSLFKNRSHLQRLQEKDLSVGRVLFANWKKIGVELIVKGKMNVVGDKIHFNCELYSTQSGVAEFSRIYVFQTSLLRKKVHQISDEIIHRITGIKGLGTSQIAFVSNRSGSKQIYTIDWDGYHLVQLTQSKNIAIYPKWALHEPIILCTDYSKGWPQIVALNLKKKTKKTLSSKPGLNAFARLSPDGKRMVLTLSMDGNPELYSCRADGTQLKRLTRSRGVESSPTWTPDGKKIIFVSNRSGSPQIYEMSSNGSGVKKLTYQGRYNTSPEISPDGTKLAYCGLVQGRFQLFVMDLESKELMQLTHNRQNNEDPSWGPSSRHLAYTASQRDSSEVYLIDIYNPYPIRLTKKLQQCSSPTWSRSF